MTSFSNRPSFTRALPWAVAGLATIGALSALPGGWGTAFGQTVPPLVSSPATSATTTVTAGVGSATLTGADGATLARVDLSALSSIAPAGAQVNLALVPAAPIDASTFAVADAGLPASGLRMVAPPVQLGLSLLGSSADEFVALRPEMASQPVQVSLPYVPTASVAPGEQPAQAVWLVEAFDEQGLSLGFQQVTGTIDPMTNTVQLNLTAGQLAHKPRIVQATITPTATTLADDGSNAVVADNGDPAAVDAQTGDLAAQDAEIGEVVPTDEIVSS